MFLYIQFCILSVSRLYISAQSVGSGTKSRELVTPKKKKKKSMAFGGVRHIKDTLSR